MKKLIIISILLAVTTIATKADGYDYPYLAFVTADNTTETMAVDGLQISFADGQLVVSNAATSKTYTLSQLAKMYFSETEETTTGIESVPNVVAQPQQPEQWFTTDGRQLPAMPSQKGVYVVKRNGKTFKVAVK